MNGGYVGLRTGNSTFCTTRRTALYLSGMGMALLERRFHFILPDEIVVEDGQERTEELAMSVSDGIDRAFEVLKGV